MDFSNEEINFFAELFKPNKKSHAHNSHVLTLQSSVPANIAHLLSSANLTLLAEVAHYQLWFPLDLKIDSAGIIKPILNALK